MAEIEKYAPFVFILHRSEIFVRATKTLAVNSKMA